jgi:hypothetical protein
MRLKSSIVLFLLSLLMSIPISAQDSPKKTFTTDDKTFSFDIPQDWTVEVINPEYGPNANLAVSNLPLDQTFESIDGLSLQISLPAPSFQIGGFSGKTFKTPKEAVEQTLPANSQVGDIDFTTPSSDSTPQPLNFQPSVPEVKAFEVNGLPAAYGYSTLSSFGVTVSQMSIVADLGNDYWVSISATSFKGGLPTIQKNEAAILDIVKSMHYVQSEAVSSGNAELPQVYSGLVGIWQRGYIKFFYPDDWYVSTPAVGVILISNKAQNVMNAQPESGQFFVQINGVAETRSSLDPAHMFGDCQSIGDEITAKEFVEKMLSTVTASRAEQLKQAGITLTQPEITTVNGKQMVYLWQYQGDIEVLSLYIDLGHGNIESIAMYAKKGEGGQFEKRLLEVAATFEYTPKPCDQSS